MKAHCFKIVVEPRENGYQAYCPALKQLGVVCRGDTASEALFHVNEEIQSALDKMREEGKPLDDVWIDDSAVEGWRGTLTVIEDQSGWTEEDFSRLGLPMSAGVKKPAPPPKKKK